MTTTDVVITIVQDLDRALVQAPNMHLKLRAAATDWDEEFAQLDTGTSTTGAKLLPEAGDEPDRPVGDDRALRADEAERATDGGSDPLDAGVPVDPAGPRFPGDPVAMGHAVDEFALNRQEHPSHRPEPIVPVDPGQADPETDRFRSLHAKLHEAVFAVIDVSENEIRYLI